MDTPDRLDQLIPLSRLPFEYALSISTWRRAIVAEINPLPCLRIGAGHPKHQRIFVRRRDVEEWIARQQVGGAVAP